MPVRQMHFSASGERGAREDALWLAACVQHRLSQRGLIEQQRGAAVAARDRVVHHVRFGGVEEDHTRGVGNMAAHSVAPHEGTAAHESEGRRGTILFVATVAARLGTNHVADCHERARIERYIFARHDYPELQKSFYSATPGTALADFCISPTLQLQDYDSIPVAIRFEWGTLNSRR